MLVGYGGNDISIHALLAESDAVGTTAIAAGTDFYPRSPCGERQEHEDLTGYSMAFLSTLSLRRATQGEAAADSGSAISIHALLAESDSKMLQKIGSFCSQTCYTTITIRDF